MMQSETMSTLADFDAKRARECASLESGGQAVTGSRKCAHLAGLELCDRFALGIELGRTSAGDRFWSADTQTKRPPI
jgi:hypothetical protein